MNSSRQIVDSLTSHLSLYHSSIPNTNSSKNLNPRSSIIKWFSALTVTQRQAHLTIFDFKFTQTLLQMIHKIDAAGHGFFFVLPDIPRTSTADDPTGCLPSLLCRKSSGLLCRVAESNASERLIRESTCLFSSREGENVKGISLLRNDSCLDSVTVSEDLVENVERFVEIMDGVSSGEFLRGEDNGGLAAEWVEMQWLKAKGYYSMEVFVANRLEVALRLAWLNSSNSVKKRGVKLKEKTHGAGLSVNVFWRKKGCIDWWRNLDDETKGKLFRIVIGKAAKQLSTEVFNGEYSRDKVWQWICKSERSPSCKDHGNSRVLQQPDAKGRWIMKSKSDSRSSFSLNSMFNSLIILEDISSKLLMFQHIVKDERKLFYSSVNTVTTPFDCVLRVFRDMLMLVSLDCTKCELLGEENTKPDVKKQKEKLNSGKNKKKGKNRNLRKPTPLARSSEDDSKRVKLTKDNGVEFLDSKFAGVNSSAELADAIQEKKLCREPCPSVVDKGCNKRVCNGNGSCSSRKGRKERNRVKHSSSQRLSGNGSQENADCLNVDSQNKAPKNEPVAESSSSETVSSRMVIGNAEHDSNSEHADSIHLPVLKDCQTMDIVGVDDQTSKVEGPRLQMDFSATPSMDSLNFDGYLSGSKSSSVNSEYPGEVLKNSGFSGKLGKVKHVEEKLFHVRDHQSTSLYDIGVANSPVYLSYEWPTVTPMQFPPGNFHLPAATDRLHLDVGHNWQNHFHQSFVPAEHRVRNLRVENGRVGVVSQPSPMSLDWPPVVRSLNGIAASVAYNYDSGFFPRRQTCFQQGFSSPSIQRSVVTTDDDKVYSSDLTDFSDHKKSQELADEHESHWMSEEDLEVHAVSGMDYNQYFGGGVMYWNPSDYPGSSFSRPPSLSSDDSSWAWREADMNRAVDDMVAFSSSYSTNGLTSPSAASFCSPFDPLGSGHQAVGYVLSESELSGKVVHSSSTTDVAKEENASGALINLSGDGEVKTGESHPYPILRPIIIPNMSRERSRSDIKRGHDHKSPGVPPSGREHPRIKRPPSPVVLCVPRAPRPPPPSPVGDSRKNRGFPTVRSGSSSPRHWGVKGWSSDGINFEEACIHMDGSEVVWPSWRNKGLSVRQLTQPVPGALLQDRLIAISQLARDQEHPDIALPLQPPESLNSTCKASLSAIHGLLHEEIDTFCKQVTAENLVRKPYISWAVKRVTRSLQVLWPRSRTNIFGSNATGLCLPSSDVDLVVCLPPVRNLEPIKEAGILEGRNGIKETCLQHAARYLANQEWVKNDSLKIVENTAIPIIMLIVEVPRDFISSGSPNLQAPKEESVQNSGEQSNSSLEDSTGSETYAPPKCFQMHNEARQDVKSVRIDISFKSPSHTGLQTTELVKSLTGRFPAATPLALVLKKFLADRSLDQSYSGGLSSYCLVLLVIRFLQHEHHLGRPISQNHGSLLMDFLYFFGNVFDPREMRVSVQGSGVYMKREPGCSIDPIYIDDPLFPANNVGRNCFRIHQCIKAFADAYSTLENELTSYPGDDNERSTKLTCKLLPKIIPSIGHFPGS